MVVAGVDPAVDVGDSSSLEASLGEKPMDLSSFLAKNKICNHFNLSNRKYKS